jgi:hypothetical protein
MLSDQIAQRKRSEALLSLQIMHNPYREDPNTLFNELSNGLKESPLDAPFDRKGMDKLKQALKKNSKLIKVK